MMGGMVDLQAIRYTTEHKKRWDAFVADSKNGTFLLQRDYMDYHADRFCDYSLMFYKGEHLMAVLPGHVSEAVYYSHAGLTYGGFILSYQVTAAMVLELFRLLMLYVRGIGSVKKLVYRPIPAMYHRYPSEEDLYALFRLNAQIAERKITSVVMPKAEIPFTTLRSRKYKLACKKGLTVCQDEAFELFWPILEQNLQTSHHRLPVHTLSEMMNLHRSFPEQIQLFRVSFANETVGGCVMYLTSEVAHVQYIASTEQGREMGALDLLFAHLLRDVYSQKKYFDFGVSVENGGRSLNEGLIFQKEGFGGRGMVYDTYELCLETLEDDKIL